MPSLAMVAFWVLGLVWGSNFIFMKWSSAYISPDQVAFLRVLFGFIPLLAFALWTGKLSRNHLKHWPHFVVMSLLATALYYYAFAEGTALLPSSIAGMLSASIPLFTFVTAAIFLRSEPLTRLSLAGTSLGFIGVLLIAQPWQGLSGSINLAGVGYMIAGALSVGVSFVYAKKFVSTLGIPPVALATYQIGLATILLGVTTDWHGITNITHDTRAAAALVIGLGVCGTGMAYMMYYYIVEQMGAIKASGSTYIPPVVALAIGAIFVGETVTTLDIIAMVVILSGVWMIQRAKQNLAPQS
ncbi:DMT family transporter [Enterovibrio coralii]|uniref:EamA domain-containing protein n=1 Tax=Enterovibrio coralii TaxID=294935 RepID=A0A135I687_9GAMM|nr:DMT family transporter [Enterovibrio coralii]KXF80970.1 hypothetical protein ATN88_18150 [Enterovibrio coralii]